MKAEGLGNDFAGCATMSDGDGIGMVIVRYRGAKEDAEGKPED